MQTTTAISVNNSTTANAQQLPFDKQNLIHEVTTAFPSPPLSSGQQSPAVRNLTPLFDQDPNHNQTQHHHQLQTTAQQHLQQPAETNNMILPHLSSEFLQEYPHPGSILNPITLDEQHSAAEGLGGGDSMEQPALFPDCLDLNFDHRLEDWMECPLSITTSQY